MTVVHKKCNAEVKVDIAKAVRLGMTPGDWGFCTGCGERTDHLVIDENGNVAFSEKVEVTM